MEEIAEVIATAEEKLQKLATMGGAELEASLEVVQAEIAAQEAEVVQQVPLPLAAAGFHMPCLRKKPMRVSSLSGAGA